MTTDRESLLAVIGLAILTILILWRLCVRAMEIPPSPDPWDKDIEKALHEPEAVEVCHRCFEPVAPGSWFCGHCGSAVGAYNNLMPYLNVFSQGEVLRNGVNDKLPRNALIVAGYLFLSVDMYMIFAPIYWVFLFKNLTRQREPVEPTETQHG